MTIAVLATLAVLALVVYVTGGAPSDRGFTSESTATVPVPLEVGRYDSRSSASTAWEFVDGLSVRITGAHRLDSEVGTQTRHDPGMALVRIDFSYTNNGAAPNVSEGIQLPVRLLYGSAQDEATSDGGYVGTSEQLTLRVPTRVERGESFQGAVSFAVPVDAVDELAVLVVEPHRFTEHLFTDVQDLLDPP